MDSDISKIQTKMPPKNFSIESIVGFNDRQSPEIDIENNISQDYKSTDLGEDERVKGRMGYYFGQNRVPNFPFFMAYEKRGFPSDVMRPGVEEKRGSSPGSVRSEVDSDGVDERPHGEYLLNIFNI